MPTSLIGRICLWGLGTTCMIVLAACGVADQQAAVTSRTTAPQAATASAQSPTAELASSSTELASSSAIPTVPATQPPMPSPKETTMPDQKPTQPVSLGRATQQPVSAPTPEGAAPANTPISAAPTSMSDHVEIAKADLARRRAVAPDTIQVVEVRNVVWPDRGLGCPRPDMAYNQVQVDGQLIRLESGGQIFEYHSGGGKPPFLCEHPPGKARPTPESGRESQ